MEKETCIVALNAIILGLMTYFWLWYLTWEATRYKGKQPEKWYEQPISRIFYRLLNFFGLRRNRD